MSERTLFPGDKIWSIETLEQVAKTSRYVYMGRPDGRPTHVGFLYSMPFRNVLKMMQNGQLWAAVKKEDNLKTYKVLFKGSGLEAYVDTFDSKPPMIGEFVTGRDVDDNETELKGFVEAILEEPF